MIRPHLTVGRHCDGRSPRGVALALPGETAAILLLVPVAVEVGVAVEAVKQLDVVRRRRIGLKAFQRVVVGGRARARIATPVDSVAETPEAALAVWVLVVDVAEPVDAVEAVEGVQAGIESVVSIIAIA